MPEVVVRLSVGSRIAWLDVVTSVAEDVAKQAGLDEDACFHVSMALREGLSNAMVHGNRRDESKLVDLTFLVHGDRLEIRIKDEGPGFEPAELPDPTTAGNRLRASGRGVFLMRNYMDEVDLARAAERGGEIRMVKRTAAPGGTRSRSGE